jgi:hypothetical protein
MKMNKTLAALAAASSLALGGFALAQSPGAAGGSDAQPKTSTPGAGCTATGNAMSAGNLGGNATNKNCDSTNTTAATPAPATAAAPATVAPDTSSSSAPSTAAAAPASTDTTASTASPAPAPKRVARADRG